jgi:hypothetical protein
MPLHYPQHNLYKFIDPRTPVLKPLLNKHQIKHLSDSIMIRYL